MASASRWRPQPSTTRGQAQESGCRRMPSPHNSHTKGASLISMQEKHGFSLTLAPSAIDHPRAGIGVWLQGKAPAGAVVAFYPGIVYMKAHYRSAFALELMHCIE